MTFIQEREGQLLPLHFIGKKESLDDDLARLKREIKASRSEGDESVDWVVDSLKSLTVRQP